MGDGSKVSTPRTRPTHRAVFLCCAALCAAGIFAIGSAASGHPPAGRAQSGGARSGVLPIAQSVASQAAAFWRGKLAAPQPSAQGPARPSASGSAKGAVPPASRLPSPQTASLSPAASAPTQYAAAAVSDPLSGSAFSGLPQVGAIFSTSDGSTNGHFCTGSVVASTRGDIVVTAAHCVYDPSTGSYLSDIAFVPGYHDSQAPYGVWATSAIVVDPRWMSDADPDYDVAFVIVHRNETGARIQDIVGGDTLKVNGPHSALSQVVGYPSASDEPITCTNYTKPLTGTQVEFDCAGFPDGTSGGPFLTDVDPATGLGTVDGVIGGYEAGGDSPDVSYTTYFSAAVADLFAKAEATH
jgi:V8-like Glu-specific endopeptidase